MGVVGCEPFEDVDEVGEVEALLLLEDGTEAELDGRECQAHQIYWKGRGRRRVSTSRCIAEEVRRGMAGRMEGLELSSCDAVIVGRFCDKLGLRERVRLSSVVERDRDGIDVSSVGKLVVPWLGTLAREVMAVGRIIVKL